MNRKKYIIASIVAALAAYLVDFLTHGFILASAYKEHSELFADMEKMTKWMWLNPIMYFGTAFLAGWFFLRGYDNTGIREGLKFGLALGLLLEVPRFCAMMMYYNSLPIFDVTALIAGLVKFILVGVLFAAIYKPLSNKL